MIRFVERDEIPQCAEIIRKSHATVAAEFKITRENSPGHTSFISDDRLYQQFDGGYPMFVLLENDEKVGYFSLEKKDESVFELNNLSVIPEKRHCGYGKIMIDYASEYAKQLGASKLTIGIIDENERLKSWYMKNGFTYLGSYRFPNFVFTAGFMEKAL